MKCKYCNRETKYVEVCKGCSAIEKDLLRYGELPGTFRIVHDNNWAIGHTIKQYEGVLIDD